MKAKQSWIIRLVKPMEALFAPDEIVPEGTVGVIVEAYNSPVEGYFVDVTLPDGRFDSVQVHPDDFIVLEEHDIDIGGDRTVPPPGTE